MTIVKTITSAAVLTAGLLAAASPSAAANAIFASFTAIGNGGIVWKNNGVGDTSTTWRSNGTGGSLYTTSSPASVRPDQAQPSSVFVSFSFLQPALAPYVTNVGAWFYLAASSYGQPATLFQGQDIQDNLSGIFSFMSSTPIMVGGTLYAAGHNLLSGSFTQRAISGADHLTTADFGTLAGPGASTLFSSDFLDFSGTTNSGFKLPLTSLVSKLNNVNQGVNFTSGHALRSFRAGVGGIFVSDPMPLFNAVPEPQVWAMLVIGFGLVGVQIRRRRGAVIA